MSPALFMIARLQGTLVDRTPTEVVVDVHGVGYAVAVSVTTAERLPAAGASVTLFVHTLVREDAIQLYGFGDEQERAVFRLLLAVPNVGPKMAIGVLSAMSVAEFREHVVRNNLVALTAIPGVGRKTAERLVIELRDKLARLELGTAPAAAGAAGLRAEAALALVSLGYARAAADQAVRRAAQELGDDARSVEQIVKHALRFATAS